MRLRAVVVAGCGLLASGCLASFQEAMSRTGSGISRDVSRALEPLENVQRRLKRCEGIRAENVAFSEEKTLGDAMGVKVTAAQGGLALTYAQAPFPAPEGPVAVSLASPDVANARARTVAVVGAGLSRHSGRPELPWRFGVLASDEVNAVSTPGGLVLVTRGALEAVKSEDALAGVLAHEVAHVVLRHALERYATEKRHACYGELLSSKMLPVLQPPDDVTPEGLEAARRLFGDEVARAITEGTVLDLNDGRRRKLLDALSSRTLEALYARGLDQPSEVAADALAVELLLAAGYRPEEFIQFVGTLPDRGAFFAHHPSPKDRVQEMTQHLATRRREEDPFRPEPRARPVPLAPALASDRK
jgi:hypothetical protein